MKKIKLRSEIIRNLIPLSINNLHRIASGRDGSAYCDTTRFVDSASPVNGCPI